MPSKAMPEMAMSCWSDAGTGTVDTGTAVTAIIGTTDTAITDIGTTVTTTIGAIITTAVTAIGAMRLRSSDSATAIRALATAIAAGKAIRGGTAGACADKLRAQQAVSHVLIA